jgi:hypothetical protein
MGLSGGRQSEYGSRPCVGGPGRTGVVVRTIVIGGKPLLRARLYGAQSGNTVVDRNPSRSAARLERAILCGRRPLE